MSRTPNPLSSASAGFAVVLTLVFVAFLALLLVTLTTLTRVEGVVIDHSLGQTAARQNALMALRFAVGKLQVLAGSDTRVTATSEGVTGSVGPAHYTGVWDTARPVVTPLAWLVSGREDPALGFDKEQVAASVALVASGSAGAEEPVTAALLPIEADARSGSGERDVVGHFAWWVGDEGVKASVAISPNAEAARYAPYDSAEIRRCVRQQLPGAAPAIAPNGEVIFDAADPANQGLTSRLLMLEQIGQMMAPGGDAVDREALRAGFFSWTANHRAVLANPQEGGLKRDLSARPELLGEAFAAWTRYRNYMEDPASPRTPLPSPAYPASEPAESLRRRFRMTAPVTVGGITHSVTPVLSYFLLSFNVRTDQSVNGALRPLEVRARWLVTLWNPYTSALVPESLSIEVAGLPALRVTSDSDGTVTTVSLDGLYGTPLRMTLPWEQTGRDDQQSWLPGRVYTWAAKEDLNKASPVPGEGFASSFYTRSVSASAGQGVQRAVSGSTWSNAALAHLQANAAQLTVRLYHTTASGARELLATALSPPFSAFSTTPAPISQGTYQFTFLWRLAESTDTPADPDDWLASEGRDPREATASPAAALSGANGPRPELYANSTAIAFPERLLDRALPASAGSSTGQSYNEDVPLFELPRAPLLSLGTLQHLHTTGTRPFAVGNTWGSAGGWNSIFDRYYLSGLTADVPLATLPDDAPLPNPALRLVTRRSNGALMRVSDLAESWSDGSIARHLLLDGAFNVNSTDPAAWRAFLRRSRPKLGETFRYLNATTATGTAGDTGVVELASTGAAFFRFGMSAGETYKADAGYAASTNAPPSAPNTASPANTHLFRRGRRTLDDAQLAALATAIAGQVRARQGLAGPFRSLAEFLGPATSSGSASVLEQAIADATTSDGRVINRRSEVPEFSSQWLTPGDLLTTLASALVIRSDTFRVRAYGDAANPVTGAIMGRSWVEAVVQRFPEYIDRGQDPATPPAELTLTNRAYGRRFRIVSFRWLDSSEL